MNTFSSLAPSCLSTSPWWSWWQPMPLPSTTWRSSQRHVLNKNGTCSADSRASLTTSYMGIRNGHKDSFTSVAGTESTHRQVLVNYWVIKDWIKSTMISWNTMGLGVVGGCDGDDVSWQKHDSRMIFSFWLSHNVLLETISIPFLRWKKSLQRVWDCHDNSISHFKAEIWKQCHRHSEIKWTLIQEKRRRILIS